MTLINTGRSISAKEIKERMDEKKEYDDRLETKRANKKIFIVKKDV